MIGHCKLCVYCEHGPHCLTCPPPASIPDDAHVCGPCREAITQAEIAADPLLLGRVALMDEPEAVCYRCKSVGHFARNCPERGSGRPKAHPPAAPKGAPESKGKPVPPRRPDSEISQNPREWADFARGLLGIPPGGDQADIYTSPFRRDQGLAPIHNHKLREIAAAQITERTGT